VEQAGSPASFEMGSPTGLGFFYYFFTPLTEAGKEIVSEAVVLPVLVKPKRTPVSIKIAEVV
jgi:hypothetical protein